ncbi:MAG TPA: hypothetical protein VJZ71_11450 [Phycisphaerae bacterium]|nr:hypothetical protein [Phycisphaerae bacterium]
MKAKSSTADGEFQIHEDIALQRKVWLAERIAWSLLALLMILALTGLLGGRGILSASRVGEPNSALWVDYERCARVGAVTELRIHARPTGERWTLSIGGNLLDHAIWSSSPLPQSTETRSNLHRLFFLPAPGTDPIQVVLRIEHRRAGRKRAEFRSEGASVLVSQFVYP